MSKMGRKNKINYSSAFLVLLILFSVKMIMCTINNILIWEKDNENTKEQIEVAKQNVKIEEREDSPLTEIITAEENAPAKSSPYWDYIKMNLIDVDIDSLKSINDSTKGWIQVNGTNINYPFVQGSDNSYYLTHSFDKSYNAAGWLFLDYRNDIENMDRNTIIYAHGRTDRTMFGSLKNILKSGWLDDVNNHVIKMSTEKENTLWQVFSVYHIPTTSDYIQVSFYNETEFLDFGAKLTARSAYDFGVTVNEFDKILTLSTCYNNTDKVVLHAKLIKKETKQ